MAKWFNTIWHVPANTPVDRVAIEFERTFGKSNIRLPKTGIMPSSKTLAGRSIVHCALLYDMRTAEEIVSKAGKNWQVWGYQSFDGDVIIDVKNVVKPFLPNNDFNDLHTFQGQGAWGTE